MMRNSSRIITVIFALLLIAGTVPAQGQASRDTAVFIPVMVKITRALQSEMQILVQQDRAYIPVRALFGFLKIPAAYDPSSNLIEGLFLSAENEYRLDFVNNVATIGGRSEPFAQTDYRWSGEDVYLRDEMYSRIFGLNLTYNPRRLEVVLRTQQPLPVVQELRRESARRRRYRPGELPASDWEVGRRFRLFSVGRLDYNLYSQVIQYGAPRQSYTLNLGNQLLGGDLETRMFGQVGENVTMDNLLTRLRYAFLDNSYLRQVYLGDVLTGGLIPSSVFGAEFTNRPAPRRFYFTTDDISGPLSAGSTADLFLGPLLVDHQPQGISEQFSFPSVVSYGVSTYEIRSYDIFGMENVVQHRIVVPPTMIPTGEIEYSVAGGVFRQRMDEKYGNANVRWGVNSRFTLGAGVDYYEEYTRKFHPTMNVTSRLTDILIGEFTLAPSAYSRGVLYLSYPSSASASVRYTWYARHPFYNPRGLTNEASASLSLPLRVASRAQSVDFFLRQSIFPSGRIRSAQVGLGGQVGPFTPRIMHRRTWENLGPNSIKDAYTTASIAFRAPAAFLVRASARYFHFDGGFRDARFLFGRRFSQRLWIQFFYERSFALASSFAGIQMTLTFPSTIFRAQVGVGDEGALRSTQSVSGSVGYSPEIGDFYFDYLASRVGYGGLVFQPFVDANGNDMHDPGEEYIQGGRMRTTTLFNKSTLRYRPGGFVIERAQPYEEYYLTLDPQYLDNPLWVPKYGTFSVIAEPNEFRRVEVPVIIGGIIRGRVTYGTNGGAVDAEGLTISITPESAAESGYRRTMITFSTGQFEFYGIPPGRYVISIDPNQVAQLGFRTDGLSRVVEVRALPEGDEIDDIDFILLR